MVTHQVKEGPDAVAQSVARPWRQGYPKTNKLVYAFSNTQPSRVCQCCADIEPSFMMQNCYMSQNCNAFVPFLGYCTFVKIQSILDTYVELVKKSIPAKRELKKQLRLEAVLLSFLSHFL